MKISMDTDQVHHEIQALRAAAEGARRVYQQIVQDLGGLAEVWQGPAPEEYYQRQQEVLVGLQQLASRLEDMAEMLEIEYVRYLNAAEALGW